MSTLRALLLLLALPLLSTGARPQTAAAPTEISLRSAMVQYVATWNSHDVAAWSALLTDDIWYREVVATDYYERSKGKPNVLSVHGDSVRNSDIVWEIKRVKIQPDNSATVVLIHTANILPKTGEKYASSFVSDPTVSRWRLEGGHWRLYYFTSHKGLALDAMNKDGMN